jgi:hypothetical protein
MKLTKIHRVLSFDQFAWMKLDIYFNTKQRKLAKNDFEIDFYKLMNNFVFGKTMKNIRDHIHAKICLNEKEASWAIRSPCYNNCPTMFDNDYGFFELEKKKLFLNKPIKLECVLDLSKTIYDFYYNFIQKKYSNKAKLLFTDTDSLVYELTIDDIFQDLLFLDPNQRDLSIQSPPRWGLLNSMTGQRRGLFFLCELLYLFVDFVFGFGVSYERK